MGHFELDVRLWASSVSTPFVVTGLIGFGFCLHNVYYLMLTAFFRGLCVFCIVICTVSLNAYNFVSFPEASGETCAVLNFARNKHTIYA